MRNLCINSKIELNFTSEINPRFVLSDDGPISYKNQRLILHSTEEESEIIDLQDTFAQEGLNGAEEFCSALSYLSDGRIIISFESGLLLSVDINVKSVEVIGSFPTGLTGVWKSPDDELLVLAAKDNAIILMTAGDFEPLLEFDPDVATNEAFANVNVGWGAKATQFHGKAGKAAREIVQESPEEAFENDLKVVWRDDGQYFAVSYVGQDKTRKIRVFNRQGQLQSTSENTKALGSSLAWKPNAGALIASSMKLPNGKDVIGFYEKNGLRHGEFPLQNPAQVHDIAWNCDASILALHITDETGDKIQLWTVSNYKWQMKKDFEVLNRHLEDKLKIHGFLWDPVSAMTLYIFAQDTCSRFELKFKIHRSQGPLSYVAIVDGKIVKVTPFTEMVIPPPISAFELHFDTNVIDLAFSQDGKDNLAVITENQVNIFVPSKEKDDKTVITGAGGSGFVPKCTLLKLEKKFEIVSGDLYNWIYYKNNLLACIPEAVFVHFIDQGTMKASHFCETEIHDVVPGQDIYHVVLINGRVLKLNGNLEDENLTLKPKCGQIESYDNYIISLNERSQRLYINENEVATGITSFFIHSHFLMVTTVKHTLKCLPLNQLSNYQNDKLWSQESVRGLERGLFNFILSKTEKRNLAAENIAKMLRDVLSQFEFGCDLTNFYFNIFKCFKNHFEKNIGVQSLHVF